MSKGREGAKKITKDYVWKYKSENVSIESQCAKPHPWDQSNKELKEISNNRLPYTPHLQMYTDYVPFK